jgi:hypothetical protein
MKAQANSAVADRTEQQDRDSREGLNFSAKTAHNMKEAMHREEV